MNRQTARQRTAADGRHRSGTRKRSQSRSHQPANPSQAVASPDSQSRQADPLKSAASRKRSPHSGLLLVLGLWTISLVSAALAARSLLDPTVVGTSNFSGSNRSNLPSIQSSNPAAPASAPIAPSAPDASGSEDSSAPVNESIAPNPTNLPGAALDDHGFYQPSGINPLPFLAMGVTTLSMAMSWVLVSRSLRSHRPTPRLEGRSGKPMALKTTAVKQPPAATAPAMPPAIVTQPFAQNPHSQTSAAAPAIVTVLPGNQSHPLDWDEPSLADSLDLRQRRSLPS